MGGMAVPALAAAIWMFICRLPSMRRSEWLMSPLRDIIWSKRCLKTGVNGILDILGQGN